MTALIWPDYIAPNSIDWWLDTPTKSGGQSILGNERIVATPAARWRATMGFRIGGTPVDPAKLLWWRTFASTMAGRAGSVAIGPFDALTPARILAATNAAAAASAAQAQWAAAQVTPSVFGSSSPFDDMAAVSAANSGVIVAPPPLVTGAGGALAADAAIGARTIVITYAGLGTPLAGMYFGIGECLYLASSIVSVSGVLTIGFSPGLRAPALAGAAVDFEKSKCVMRLMADDGARARTGVDWTADATLDLVEVF
jgi:hypothetical protein